MRWIRTVAILGALLTAPAFAVETTHAADASLTAPEQVDARHPIRVEWTGPAGRYDTVQLFDPRGDGRRVHEMRLRGWKVKESVVVFPAPAEPGAYELRYWDGETKAVLATRPIEVVPGTVEITAPASVELAGTITVQWEGPGGEFDMVRLFDENADYGNHGELQIVREKRVRSGDFDAKRVQLVGPAVPGKYELQYIDGQSHAALASRPIEVKKTEVTLDAPANVVAGEQLTVQWVGPAALGDEVQIVNARGKRRAGLRVRQGDLDGRSVDFAAPKTPGSYVLRYWSAANRKALVTQPIEIVAAQGG